MRAKFLQLNEFLGSWVSAAEVNCVAAAIGGRQRLDWRAAAGQAHPESRFDLASLTKPVMVTLGLALDRAGVLPLRTRVADLHDGPSGARRLRLDHLLRHRAGLPPWLPLASLARGSREADELLRALLALAGPAKKSLYSDLGFIAWGLLVERATGRSLADLLAKHVAGPLGLDGLGAWPARGAARCLCDTGKEAELARAAGVSYRTLPAPKRGQVQDGNARFLGRLSAHAGLFATVEDLWKLGREWLAPGRVLTREQVRAAVAGHDEYGLGWAHRRVRGSAGPALGSRAFGHTGFTGGSLWIDPDRGRIFVLLAHRADWRSDLMPRRREFHRLATQP
jgi:CubicO group peptidase (beta-lactamase class C family)